MIHHGPLRFAIVGLGHLHPRAYMPLFQAHPDTDVVACCDEDDALRASFSRDFQLRSYPTLDALLEQETLDAVAMFLPHCDCEAAALKCARAGLHLMVEKPMAHTLESAGRIVAAAKDRGVKLTTGYCWRYHPVVAAMKEALRADHIGRVVSVEARLAAGRVDRYVTGHSAWMLEKKKSGGGPMFTLGVHWLDLLHFLLDDRITQVCATHTHSSSAYDIEDSTVALLRFAGGPVGVLSTSYIVPDCYPNGRDLYIGIKGEQGVLSYAPRYEGEQGSVGAGQTDTLELYSDAPALAGASARRLTFQLDPVAGYSGYMGKAYVDGFVRAIREDREPEITGDQALEVMKIVKAMYASGEQQTWIEVSE